MIGSPVSSRGEHRRRAAAGAFSFFTAVIGRKFPCSKLSKHRWCWPTPNWLDCSTATMLEFELTRITEFELKSRQLADSAQDSLRRPGISELAVSRRALRPGRFPDCPRSKLFCVECQTEERRHEHQGEDS
jgi:hypothetical protein